MGEVALADIAVPHGCISGPFGSNLVGTDYASSGVPVIRGANMAGPYIGGEFAFVTKEKFARDLTRSSVVSGDLIFTQRGTLGQVAMVPAAHYAEYVVSQSQMGLRVDEAVADPKFVYYACRDARFLKQISDNSISTGVPHINLGILARLTIPRPPLADQRAIADVLGALDDKVAANERVGNVAMKLSHSLVLRVIGSTGTELIRTNFGELGELFDGPHATPTRRSEGPYFLNISSLKSGRLDLTESDHVSESDFSNWTRRVTPQAGDLLFSYETRIGQAALMPDDVRACLGRRMALLRPDQARVDPVFLLHFYLSPAFQRTIERNTIHGATVPRIGLATMGDWEVEIPALQEQHAIAGALGSLHEDVVQSERESARLESVRDELLPLLMSGKVRVKDAEAVLSDAI
jgi:type I restriction enzyme S subunit